jgi:hypothetical protein
MQNNTNLGWPDLKLLKKYTNEPQIVPSQSMALIKSRRENW